MDNQNEIERALQAARWVAPISGKLASTLAGSALLSTELLAAGTTRP